MLWLLAPLAAASAQQPAKPEQLKINERGFTRAEACGKCHTQMYEAWKESMHARAVSDPIFQAAYLDAYYKTKGGAARLCLRCHAPITQQSGDFNLDAPLTSEGVACDFCHSLKEVNLDDPANPHMTAPGLVKRGPNKDGAVKVHQVEYSKLHGDARLCASCHEYRANGVPVMTTYSEWKQSPYAEEGKPCQYCHMPEAKGQISEGVEGRRGGMVFTHNLAGGHSITQLKKALALKITRVERKDDRMTVHVDLTNSGSGHRVPTGIPTRKLILYCEARVPGGKVYKEKIVYEKVIFDKNQQELRADADIMLGLGAAIASDNRIFPKETRQERFTFYIPKGKDARVAVWVDYLYEPLIVQAAEMRIEMNRDEITSAP